MGSVYGKRALKQQCLRKTAATGHAGPHTADDTWGPGKTMHDYVGHGMPCPYVFLTAVGDLSHTLNEIGVCFPLAD